MSALRDRPATGPVVGPQGVDQTFESNTRATGLFDRTPTIKIEQPHEGVGVPVDAGDGQVSVGQRDPDLVLGCTEQLGRAVQPSFGAARRPSAPVPANFSPPPVHSTDPSGPAHPPCRPPLVPQPCHHHPDLVVHWVAWDVGPLSRTGATGYG